jgi:hypothetical protein
MEESNESDGVNISIEFEKIVESISNNKLNETYNENGKQNIKKIRKSKDINSRKRNVSLVKKIIIEVFSKSTTHGVQKIIQSKVLILRIMWILFLFLSSLLFGTMTLFSKLDYSKFEVTTKIRTIYERPTLFPTVTVVFVFLNFKIHK